MRDRSQRLRYPPWLLISAKLSALISWLVPIRVSPLEQVSVRMNVRRPVRHGSFHILRVRCCFNCPQLVIVIPLWSPALCGIEPSVSSSR